MVTRVSLSGIHGPAGSRSTLGEQLKVPCRLPALGVDTRSRCWPAKPMCALTIITLTILIWRPRTILG